MTNDINGTGKGIQSGESKADTTADASSAEVSGQTSKPSDSAEENSTAQKDTGGKNEQTKADNRQTENNNNTAVTQSENHTNGTRVYVTPSGKKYHLSASCGGDNSYETTLEEALCEGKTPCKKCAQ